MSNQPERGEYPPEMPAIKTTIVGGRPPGCGQPVGDIPRGIEILIKKASIDPEFRRTLLLRRADAAGEIGLLLEPAEKLMLNTVPAAQLEAIIARTPVESGIRQAFLGKAAAVMLAALGASTVVATGQQAQNGVRVAMPPPQPAPTQPASQPVKQVSTAEIAPLVAQLDAAEYAARQAAQKKLEELGPGAIAAIEETLKRADLTANARYLLEVVLSKAKAAGQPRVGTIQLGATVRLMPAEVQPGPVVIAGVMVAGPAPMVASAPGTQPGTAPASRPAAVAPIPFPVAGAAAQPVPRAEVPPPAPPVMRVAGIRAGPVQAVPAPQTAPANTQPASQLVVVPAPVPPERFQMRGLRAEPVQPAPPATLPAQVPVKDIEPLLPRLDKDDWREREAAQKELEKLGATAVTAIEEILKRKDLSAETRIRLETALRKVKPQADAPDDVRPMLGAGTVRAAGRGRVERRRCDTEGQRNREEEEGSPP